MATRNVHGFLGHDDTEMFAIPLPAWYDLVAQSISLDISLGEPGEDVDDVEWARWAASQMSDAIHHLDLHRRGQI